MIDISKPSKASCVYLIQKKRRLVHLQVHGVQATREQVQVRHHVQRRLAPDRTVAQGLLRGKPGAIDAKHRGPGWPVGAAQEGGLGGRRCAHNKYVTAITKTARKISTSDSIAKNNFLEWVCCQKIKIYLAVFGKSIPYL